MALPVKVSHDFVPASAVFDDDHLVSCAGLVPVKSGSANPSPKLTTVIAGMCVGADSIEDLDVVRSGGMKTLFESV